MDADEKMTRSARVWEDVELTEEDYENAKRKAREILDAPHHQFTRTGNLALCFQKFAELADATELHDSWRDRTQEELLEALAFQGAMTRALLDRSKELLLENTGLRASLLTEDEADALMIALPDEESGDECGSYRFGRMKIDAATTKTGALLDVINDPSRIKPHRLRVALEHMIESGEGTGRDRDAVLSEFSVRTNMSRKALEDVLQGHFSGEC